MIDIFYSILAGVIQGLTEFLPISSSGHLVLLHDFIGFDFVDNVAFDVVLHLGTLLALVVFFWADIIKYLLAWIRSFFNWNLAQDVNQRLAWYLLIGTLPAAVVGYFLEAQIESVFRGSVLVAIVLIIFGILLYLVDHFSKKIRTIDTLNFSGSFLIGLAQALALVPGVSRSGITIIAGLSQKLKREDAARFSFLLSIPIVFGAGLKKVFDLISTENLMSGDVLSLVLGFLSSALAGYLCIKYFLRFLQNHSLKIFAYYRIILGAVILLVLAFMV